MVCKNSETIIRFFLSIIQPELPQRNCSVPELDIVLDNDSVGNILDLPFAFIVPAYLKRVLPNDKIRFLGKGDFVLYPHLIIEKSLMEGGIK